MSTPEDFEELARQLHREREITAPFPTDEELAEFLLRNGYQDRQMAEDVIDQFRGAFRNVRRPLPPRP